MASRKGMVKKPKAKEKIAPVEDRKVGAHFIITLYRDGGELSFCRYCGAIELKYVPLSSKCIPDSLQAIITHALCASYGWGLIKK